MALPRLNENPEYELEIPSTKQKVRFRPFLVKEEKVLMIAMESDNQKDILNTVVNTITTCINESIEKRSLTTFDVEYLFLKIRAKSVGETSTIGIKCESCETSNDVKINIDEVKMDVPDIDGLIKLNDQVSVEMRWPSYQAIINDDIMEKESSVDQVFSLIRSSISSIMTNDERFAASDHTAEELDAFIESMDTKQFTQIREYVEKMPKLSHPINFTCSHCAAKNSIQLEGMQNFFS